eukprot:TRINITY_DN4704_c0_g1_i1.p1 TRINITY_DN4704_c0_g1~~TRINITY_DN4704_c0_g1_i1.p1  ORF type:complete len:127 (+),score=26.81 TRINITY_DN4704_c0_g1_i1:252-632(+)
MIKDNHNNSKTTKAPSTAISTSPWNKIASQCITDPYGLLSQAVQNPETPEKLPHEIYAENIEDCTQKLAKILTNMEDRMDACDRKFKEDLSGTLMLWLEELGITQFAMLSIHSLFPCDSSKTEQTA